MSARFFQGYLFAYLFWLQLGFGSTALLMISFLTGGEWGALTRRILEAASRTQLALAALFLPILVGARDIYPWTDAALVAGDPHLKHKALYLNIAFFRARALFYLACWVLVSRVLDSTSQKQFREKGVFYKARLRALSAGCLVLYAFSVSFAAMDWQMSLEPLWYSTIYGMIFGVSQLLAAWAFALLAFVWVGARGAARAASPKAMRDLGNILMTFVIVWAYLSFMQYLIVWSGNLPEEVVWAKHRVEHGWQWIALLLVAFQFGAPFLLLLFRSVKTRPRALAAVAALVLAINAFDRYWQSMPSFHERVYFDWFAVANLLGIGVLWMAVFLRYLAQRPLVDEEARAHA